MFNLTLVLSICLNRFILSSLRSVIEKPPIGGKELVPLTSVQLAGFRLHPGPVSIDICGPPVYTLDHYEVNSGKDQGFFYCSGKINL